MTTALYVRETIDLSDATEQLLLRFARKKGLIRGDTLVVSGRTVTAAPGYRFDLRDPADPSYLLNLALVAGRVEAPGLAFDLSGDPAAGAGTAGDGGRSVQVFAAELVHELAVRADGGAGAVGSPGAAGTAGSVTIELDDRGKPHRFIEDPTPGGPGMNGGPGGPGGTVAVFWCTGVPPRVGAAGGRGGDGGPGGPGGLGARMPNGVRQPKAPDGPPGQPGPAGLAGSALNSPGTVDQLWNEARARLGANVTAIAEHWAAVAGYGHRLFRGIPTPAEADVLLNLLDLTLGADPTRADAAGIRTRFLAGDNALGLPRVLDVVADFDRYLNRVQLYGGMVDRLFADTKDLLAAAGPAGLTEAQLQVHLTTLDFTKEVLTAASADAKATLAAAVADERTAVARWDSARGEVDRRRDELEKPIDWGGVVVVGLFAIASVIVSAYVGQTAGKLVGSIPDLMTLGNVNFSGSAKETEVLKAALSAGKDLRPQGAKDAAGHQNANGDIDVGSWAAAGVPVVISFAKFVKDLDEANGDAGLKALVKDLAKALQERLAARGRVEAAQRQVALAAQRVEGVQRERDGYAALHTRARSDAALLRQTGLQLLRLVREYGDVFLEYQFRAARAVEIYTMRDQSAAMNLDRWHVHPDVERDFAEDLIGPVEYLGRLLNSSTELAVARLTGEFDGYDMASFQPDVHYVTVDDPARLAAFRQQHSLTVPVAPADLGANRRQAKVVAATVTLHGVTAATPTFPIVVTHGPRSTDLLTDGTEVTRLGALRSTLVQVAGAAGTSTGTAANPAGRPTEFWRRSVGTEWTVAIEDEVVTRRSVDLTGLSRIDLTLSYLAVRT
jgi:hypothetical protein